MQDQAFLGPESGMAIPTEDGGVELLISTQWLHVDHGQVAACLGLPAGQGAPDPRRRRRRVRGARGRQPPGARLPARAGAPGRPVKIQYSREESFHGHVHRHPARMWFRHTATARRRPRQASRPACCSTAARTRRRRRRCSPTRSASPAVRTASRTRRSTAGRCGPTTRRAARCAASASCRSASPTRRRWTSSPTRSGWTRSSCGCATRMQHRRPLLTGQVITGTAPVREVIEACVAHPLPGEPGARRPADGAARRRGPDRRRAATSAAASASRSASRT